MFSENYEVVFNWLENQIRNNKSDSIFLAQNTALRAFKNLDKNLAILDEDRSGLDHFISVHLNKSAIVKLKTTVRIFKKRESEKSQSSQLLQCTLYAQSSEKLGQLVELSKMTKIEIINKLIISADFADFMISTEE
jgi:macrodomain Ter protein organizer (MatP/YcbG family)